MRPTESDIMHQLNEHLDSPQEPDKCHPQPKTNFIPTLWTIQQVPSYSGEYQHEFNIPMFKYLTLLQRAYEDAQEAHVHICKPSRLNTVAHDTAVNVVTAQAVQFALQSTLPEGQ